MKTLIVSAILSLYVINCKGQQKDTLKPNNFKKETMEYFDLKKYKDLPINKERLKSSSDFYFKDNNKYIDILYFINTIQVEEYYDNKSIKIIKVYHNNTLLKSTVREFNSFPIGITKEYDENGKLIKEIDNDKNYPFKVEDLCKLIKEEYGVDLMVKSDYKKNILEYRVDRRYESLTQQYLYLVVFSCGYSDEGEGRYPVKVVYIDGTNGKVLYEDAEFLELPNGDKIPKSKTKFPQKGEKEKKTSSIYKTHQGKSYTKTEWEDFEEKQYEEYCKRTGRSYTPKEKATKPQDSIKKSSFIVDEEKGDNHTPKKKKGFWDNLFK
ncbi:hypothetical protein [Flavobacterium oreochromis]|uniref:Lipoprotein n=1 Tax=Flavobacterium oreochromis TaxID=2906078 RepID=A0ABW8PCA4_9FLAO